MKFKGRPAACDVVCSGKLAEGLCSLLGSQLVPALGRPALAAFPCAWWQQPSLNIGVQLPADLAALGHDF